MGISDPSFLAPAFQVNETTVGPGATFAQVLPADPYRISVLFSVIAGAGTAAILTTSPANSSGIAINKGVNVDQFTFVENGGLVQQAWYAKQLGGGVTLTIIETRYLPYLLDGSQDDGFVADGMDEDVPESGSGNALAADWHNRFIPT